MKLKPWEWCLLAFVTWFAFVISSNAHVIPSDVRDKDSADLAAEKAPQDSSEVSELKEDASQGRFLASLFAPLFPQFYNVDYGAVYNNFKRPPVTGFFVVRDTLQYLWVITGWILLHSFVWQGRAGRDSEVPFPLSLLIDNSNPIAKSDDGFQTPFGSNEEVPDHLQEKTDQAEERLRPQSFLSFSRNALYNFLVDPSRVAGNLFLSLGFGAGGMLVWFLPSLLWSGAPLPENDSVLPIKREGDDLQVEDRLANVLAHIATGTSASEVYNRLLCPQCVANILAVQTIGILGRYLFWTVITFLPELPSPLFIRPFVGSGRSYRPTSSWLEGAELGLEAFLESLVENIENVESQLA